MTELEKTSITALERKTLGEIERISVIDGGKRSRIWEGDH